MDDDDDRIIPVHQSIIIRRDLTHNFGYSGLNVGFLESTNCTNLYYIQNAHDKNKIHLYFLREGNNHYIVRSNDGQYAIAISQPKNFINLKKDDTGAFTSDFFGNTKVYITFKDEDKNVIYKLAHAYLDKFIKTPDSNLPTLTSLKPTTKRAKLIHTYMKTVSESLNETLHECIDFLKFTTDYMLSKSTGVDLNNLTTCEYSITKNISSKRFHKRPKIDSYISLSNESSAPLSGKKNTIENDPPVPGRSYKPIQTETHAIGDASRMTEPTRTETHAVGDALRIAEPTRTETHAVGDALRIAEFAWTETHAVGDALRIAEPTHKSTWTKSHAIENATRPHTSRLKRTSSYKSAKTLAVDDDDDDDDDDYDDDDDDLLFTTMNSRHIPSGTNKSSGIPEEVDMTCTVTITKNEIKYEGREPSDDDICSVQFYIRNKRRVLEKKKWRNVKQTYELVKASLNSTENPPVADTNEIYKFLYIKNLDNIYTLSVNKVKKLGLHVRKNDKFIDVAFDDAQCLHQSYMSYKELKIQKKFVSHTYFKQLPLSETLWNIILTSEETFEKMFVSFNQNEHGKMSIRVNSDDEYNWTGKKYIKITQNSRKLIISENVSLVKETSYYTECIYEKSENLFYFINERTVSTQLKDVGNKLSKFQLYILNTSMETDKGDTIKIINTTKIENFFNLCKTTCEHDKLVFCRSNGRIIVRDVKTNKNYILIDFGNKKKFKVDNNNLMIQNGYDLDTVGIFKASNDFIKLYGALSHKITKSVDFRTSLSNINIRPSRDHIGNTHFYFKYVNTGPGDIKQALLSGIKSALDPKKTYFTIINKSSRGYFRTDPGRVACDNINFMHILNKRIVVNLPGRQKSFVLNNIKSVSIHELLYRISLQFDFIQKNMYDLTIKDNVVNISKSAISSLQPTPFTFKRSYKSSLFISLDTDTSLTLLRDEHLYYYSTVRSNLTNRKYIFVRSNGTEIELKLDDTLGVFIDDNINSIINTANNDVMNELSQCKTFGEFIQIVMPDGFCNPRVEHETVYFDSRMPMVTSGNPNNVTISTQSIVDVYTPKNYIYNASDGNTPFKFSGTWNITNNVLTIFDNKSNELYILSCVAAIENNKKISYKFLYVSNNNNFIDELYSDGAYKFDNDITYIGDTVYLVINNNYIKITKGYSFKKMLDIIFTVNIDVSLAKYTMYPMESFSEIVYKLRFD